MPEAAILVVDDDAPIRRMLDRTLTAEGYAVATAADGGEALAAVERSTPDLLDLVGRELREERVPEDHPPGAPKAGDGPVGGPAPAGLVPHPDAEHRHPGAPRQREQAVLEIWQGNASANVVDRYVSNLRQKLGEPPLIETVRGTGFIVGR